MTTSSHLGPYYATHDPSDDQGILRDAGFPGAQRNYQSRFYDPLVARFIQPDSIVPTGGSNPQALNRYSYVDGNPATLSDPTGHCKWGLPCPNPVELVTDVADVAGDAAGGVVDVVGSGLDVASDAGSFVIDDVVVDGYRTTTDIAGGAWDRGTTFGAYQGTSWWRRIRNPGQTIKDIATGTFFAEEAAAAYIIGVENADLYWAGDHCGEHGACFTGIDGLPSGGMTIGHTVLFRSERPRSGLIAHEFQHVFDVETVGSLFFYPTYFAEDLARKWTVGGDNFWDVRAYNTGGRGQHFRDPTHFGKDPWFDVRSFGEWIASWVGE